MKRLITGTICLLVLSTHAQVGIGTASPNSTLDVRGSLSTAVRTFGGPISIADNDHTLVFTGSAAATATLPDASACTGRIYCIKNFSVAIPAPVLSIATVASQKIDGLSSWLLDETNGMVTLISDGANWEIHSSGAGGNAWIEGGNGVSAARNLGTTGNFDLPFITNSTERMRITNAGYVGIGSTSFASSPEALLVYQNNPTSYNVISGKGNINNYLQLNIQNGNGGTNASSDVVATADNGNETVNYVDLGINSSGNSSGVMGAANDAYLYTTGNNFLMGTATAAKSLVFLTGGTTQAANERMRIDGAGNVIFGKASVTSGTQVFANSTNSNTVTLTSGATTSSYTMTLPTTQGGANTVLTNNGSGALAWNTIAAASGAWSINGNAGTTPGSNFIGTTDNQSLVFKANNQLSGKIDLAVNNTLFGYQAGQAATGISNTFLGYQAGYPTTTGFSNTSVGAISMVANTTGSSNTAVGYAALRANTTGTNNTAIGNGSAVTNTTGSNNTFIGYGADATAVGLSNATGIGNNAKVASSNTLILGGTGTSAVNVGIGTNTFNATNPEKFVVDAGTTTSVNSIVGKGSINNYLQLNIWNQNAGANASSDVVATADNGSETINYVDLGINSSVNSSGIMGAANDAYLYTTGNNFLIGTGTAAKALVFVTGGTTQSSNERMRIDGSGNVGIGTTNPGNKLEVNSGSGGASGLRLKQLPQGAVLFMNATADVSQSNNNLFFDGTNYRLSVAAGTSPASTLQVGGSFAAGITTKTSNYTASVSDHTILCNNTAGAITISLPPAAGCTGRTYVIKKVSAAGNNVVLAGYNGTETIDGSTTYTITNQYTAILLQSDGTNWYILSIN